MIEPVPPSVQSQTADPILDDLLAEFASRLQAGTGADLDTFIRDHPERAEVLRRLLPAIAVLADLDQSTATADAGRAPGAPGLQTALGDFLIRREVGRGGMGIVYEAEQLSLGRRVALKVLPFAAALDARQLQRFKNEAQAAAHLQHQHIVPVYGIGCERGVHYYAMQYIDGQTLAAVIQELRHRRQEDAEDKEPRRQEDKETRNAVNRTVDKSGAPGSLSPCLLVSSSGFYRTVANLGIQAAEALEHAHQQGIVHRDIKPANLLVEWRTEGVNVDWRPGGVNPQRLWITDFGLAHIQSQAGLTMSGDLVGTLRYMSPEQALAKRVPVDHRTDLYSLGVTLYELLTLQPVFDGSDREELLRQIAFEEPRPPRRCEPAVPTELETIVLKAMAKNPDERYATAQELADDLRRFLEEKPIRARRPTLRQRAVKWARRHKTVVRAALVVFLLAVAGLVISTALIWRANDDLNRANADLKGTLDRERQNAYYQRIALAEREWSANNLNRMLQLLNECPPDLRGWEWYYLQRLRLKPLPPLRHDAAVFSAAFSPDGERIASAAQDGKVTIWDARRGRQLFQFRAHDKHVRSVAYSPDGRLLATSSWDKTAKVWDVQTLVPERAPSPLRTLSHRGVRYSAVFSPDGKRLASAGHYTIRLDGLFRQFAEVKIWDPVSGQELCTLEGQERPTWSAVTFSPDGQFLATGHHEEDKDGIVGKVVHIWEANTGRKIRTLVGHDQPVQSVAFSPDGRLLASGAGKPADVAGADGELKIWDVPTGRVLFDLRGHITVFALAFSPDGRRLASAGQDHTIKLWDPATGKEVITLRGHADIVRTVAFSPNGRQLVSASHDMTVRVWDATPLNGQTDSASVTLRGHEGDVASLAFSPDGHYLVSAGLDRTVRVWDARTGEQLKALQGHKGVVLTLALSPDGRWLASRGSLDPTVTIWDTTTWEVNRLFHQPSNRINHSVAFSPNGKLLAAGGASPSDVNQQVVIIRDASTGREIHRMPGDTWNISGVAFDRTGEFLASAGADSTVHIWDVHAGKQVVTLQPGHEGCATCVDFSPDGRYLASGSLDRTLKIWSTRTWTLRRTLPDAYGGIQSLAFAPDSQRVAWGGTDATVKIADVTTGLIMETLRGHTGRVNKVAFSADGQQIASASADGTVKIWKAPPVAEPRAGETRNQGP
jgi:WD40 repeat protein/serine/threonine protein kinase